MEIYWRFIIDTPQPKKVEGVMKRLQTVLGESYTVEEKGLYWKDSSKTLVLIREVVEMSISQNWTMQLFHKLSKISNSWDMIIPNDIDEKMRDLSGVCCNSIKVAAVSWVSFMIS